MSSKRIVINELRLWRKRLCEMGVDCKVCKGSTRMDRRYKILASAWNDSTKQFHYLLVRKEETK